MRYYSAVKKRIIFYSYCFILISALVLCLTLIPKLTKRKENFATTKSSVYATDLKLNCPRELKVEVGTPVTLSTNFLCVEPQTAFKELEIEISSKKGNEEFIEFTNNTIFAKQAGFYYINFKVYKDKNNYLSETLVINAVENDNKIVQRLDNIYEGEILPIESVLLIDDAYNSTITTCNNTLLKDDSIKFLSVGESKISVTLTNEYTTTHYTFLISVIELPKQVKYEIFINNYYEATIGETLLIPYEIKCNNGGFVSQKLNVEIEDKKLELISADECFIILKCKDVGNATIKVSVPLDNNVYSFVEIVIGKGGWFAIYIS